MVQTYKDIDQNWNTVMPIVWLYVTQLPSRIRDGFLTDRPNSTAELCVGIMCACMPSLAPLYTKKLLSSMVPESLLKYLRPLRSWGSSTNVGYWSTRDASNASQDGTKFARSDVDTIELIDKPVSNGIHQTTKLDVSILKV